MSEGRREKEVEIYESYYFLDYCQDLVECQGLGLSIGVSSCQ